MAEEEQPKPSLLEVFAHKIAVAMNESGGYRVTLPAELELLHKLGEAGVHEFAARHGWGAVWHMDGQPIEFYKVVPK